jgi:hypothetical protein
MSSFCLQQAAVRQSLSAAFFFSGISEADYLLGRRFDLELTELGAAGRKFYQENS